VNDYIKTAIATVLLSAAMTVGAQSTTGDLFESPPNTTMSPADPATTDEATSVDRESAADETQSTESFADNRLPSTASPLWLATLASGGVFVMLGSSLWYLRRRLAA
jgi:hypothetical protein